MRIVRCDHCRDPEAPASEILVNIVRRIPAASGKRGSNMAVAVPAGMELCGPCAVRYALLVRNQVEAIREGRFDLPSLPNACDADTVDLTQGDVPVLLDSDQQEILLRATDTGIEPEAAPEHPRHKRGRATG